MFLNFISVIENVSIQIMVHQHSTHTLALVGLHSIQITQYGLHIIEIILSYLKLDKCKYVPAPCNPFVPLRPI